MPELIYRGETVAHTLPTTVYRKPEGLNWRYHAPGESYSTVTRSVGIQHTSRALNWRYQVNPEA